MRRSILLLLMTSALFGQLKLSSGINLSCQDCHITENWQTIRLSGFDHETTAFPLRGSHSAVSCDQCHPGQDFASVHRFSDAPDNCLDCHTDVHSGRNGDDCSQCHNSYSWNLTDDRFDHSMTAFPLMGSHAKASCESCHQTNYSTVSSECGLCHVPEYVSAPEHLSKQYPSDCSLCHDAAGWTSNFDHNVLGFGLTGAHASLKCSDCHSDGFTVQSGDCQSCHLSDYQAAVINHSLAGFDVSCQICHSTENWSSSNWNHNTTDYPLYGKHLSASCTACHSDGTFASTTQLCFDCHELDYLQAKDPVHTEDKFAHTCEDCHDNTGWTTETFDHTGVDFPLEGGHRITDCTVCHGDPVVYSISAECVSCHLTDYQATTTPNHTESGFSQNCAACHTTYRWAGAVFDHSLTGFPLTGGHDLGDGTCETCHQNLPKDQLVGAACYDCHHSNFENTTSPDHVAGNFPVTCDVCHSIDAWKPAEFNHDLTNFPLTGKHTDVTCDQCHIDEDYSVQLSMDCANCHNPSDIEGANLNWDHITHQTISGCESCHRTEGWLPSIFLHSDGLTCSQCHQPEYDNTVNPPHTNEAFPPENCSSCHSTDAWTDALFDHSLTAFPLNGAHASVICTQCHIDNQYSNMPTDCGNSMCHLSDYDNTSNPDHQASGFPTDCQACHTETGWTPATFDHDNAFPIYSGRHRDAWHECTDCHIGAIYPDFSCTSADGCHRHPLNTMNNEHDEVRGYTTNPPSSECLRCHPDGNADGDKSFIKPGKGLHDNEIIRIR